MAGRSLRNVVQQMLDCIPANETEWVEQFKWHLTDVSYRAPEDMLGWQLVSESLQEMNLTLNSPEWMFDVCSIFSTMTKDEIRNELKKLKK